MHTVKSAVAAATPRTSKSGKKSKRSAHPYLAGNFYPVDKELDLCACQLVHGSLPEELSGGQYIRNGGNAFFPPEEGQAYHL